MKTAINTKFDNGAYGVVVTQKLVELLVPVQPRIGTHEKKTRSVPFFDTWVGAGVIFLLADKTDETGSKVSVSNGKQKTCDTMFTFIKIPLHCFDFSVLL